MNQVKRKLEKMGIKYVSAIVTEGGVTFDQLFFHDPDGYMIEICDCHKLPVVPLMNSCPLVKNPSLSTPTKLRSTTDWMMDSLITDIINITF
ncbi:hypothetical protein QJS10_CPB11g00905 [Acorus calamus]|uniref:VOC domain-containing protein n=1 Tax=Acorus calamus TaxID=4465 RepID=A0AAV9DV83_ACOCL|nr:hypothetical protein QJS10_CPB11g00905 [Acorus calamus]